MSTVSDSNLLVEEVRIDGYSQPVAVRSFRPGRRERRLSIVLYFHGGLFTAGTLDETAAACGTLALEAHAWVLSVDYSLAPAFPFPSALEDAHRALQWARAQAGTVCADKRRMAVAGHDAGGNIAAGLAAVARDRGDICVRAQLLFAPLLDPSMTRVGPDARNAAPKLDALAHAWQAYLPSFAQRIHPYAAPLESRRLAKLPAAFIASVEHDPLHAEAEHYAAALITAGVPTQCERYAETTRNGIAAHTPALLAASRFLQLHLAAG
ncbi:alpha/beta hydrolase [Paraburkholderia sp. JHI869]|uniref:alpha/beta hydrolase n=1 Tax=Paraburkholderia sp. JHI869 TaxID=3112959 RepID=UPI00317F53A3